MSVCMCVCTNYYISKRQEKGNERTWVPGAESNNNNVGVWALLGIFEIHERVVMFGHIAKWEKELWNVNCDAQVRERKRRWCEDRVRESVCVSLHEMRLRQIVSNRNVLGGRKRI